jgi:TolB-like protein/DNA-binding winged helix-turn-helix (wHTH) protein
MEQPVQSARRFRFSSFEVSLDAGEVRKHGLRVKVQDKPFQVLAVLLERAGQVVTREELRQCLWPADTFVNFDANLNTALNKLRHALGDSADNPRFIATIPRRGYCFIAPVEPIGEYPEMERTGTSKPPLPPGVSSPQPSPTGGGFLPKRRTRIVALIFLTAAVIVLPFILGWPRLSPATGKTLVLVLPFENLSGDPTQEYFSDGLTDELITQLGRLQPDRLGAIARALAMRHRNTRKPLDQVARELGADYVLEGSVRRWGGRVSISAQLIRTRQGAPLWAETYERDLKDAAAIQRDVAARIAESLALKLLAPSRRPTPN